MTKIKKKVKRLKGRKSKSYSSKNLNRDIDVNIRSIQRSLAELGFGYKLIFLCKKRGFISRM